MTENSITTFNYQISESFQKLENFLQICIIYAITSNIAWRLSIINGVRRHWSPTGNGSYVVEWYFQFLVF